MPSGTNMLQRSPFPAGRRAVRGFTLIELMVAVAVIGIVAMIAIPSLRWMINSSRLSGGAEELSSALQLARSEATRRNAPVTLCPTVDGVGCASTDTWSRWIIIGRDNTTGNDEVVRDESIPGALQVSGPADGIRFHPSGLIDAQALVTVCMSTSTPSQNQRVLTVMISGSINTSKASGTCS